MTNAYHYQNTFCDDLAEDFQEILSIINKSQLLLLQDGTPLMLQHGKLLEINHGD